MELVEQDPDFIALSLQFKASAMDLISVLEQVKWNFFCWFYNEILVLDHRVTKWHRKRSNMFCFPSFHCASSIFCVERVLQVLNNCSNLRNLSSTHFICLVFQPVICFYFRVSLSDYSS